MDDKQKRLAAGGAAAALVLAGVLFALTRSDDDDTDTGGTRSTGDEVTVGDSADRFTYPTSVTGTAGQRTTFVNDDDVVHTFTSDDGHFDSGAVDAGGEFAIDTLPAGTYAYHCSIHPELKGQLEIT